MVINIVTLTIGIMIIKAKFDELDDNVHLDCNSKRL